MGGITKKYVDYVDHVDFCTYETEIHPLLTFHNCPFSSPSVLRYEEGICIDFGTDLKRIWSEGEAEVKSSSFSSFKFRRWWIAWKAILLVTEVHTRRRRGCPRIVNLPPTISAWKAVPNWHTHDVLPSRQKNNNGLLSPHILVSLVCTGFFPMVRRYAES